MDVITCKSLSTLGLNHSPNASGLVAMFVSADFLDSFVTFGQLLNMWAVVNAQLCRRYYPEVKLRYTRFAVFD